jgi:hypothetical protein
MGAFMVAGCYLDDQGVKTMRELNRLEGVLQNTDE